MKVGIVVANMPHHLEHAQALAEGLGRHGIETNTYSERRDGWLPPEENVACWGWRIGEPIRKAGRAVLVMERGFIDRMRYCSLGWNGLNGHARRDWPTDGVLRFQTQFPTKLRPWNPNGGYVLLIGQVQGDSAVRGVSLPDWYKETASRAWGLPVRFRPHPVSVGFGIRESVPWCETSHASLSDDLANAAVVVTWNSNTGVDALLAGKPTIVRGTGSMATIAATDWTIQTEPDRLPWAAQLAWSQFSLDELRSGFAWDVIKDSQTEH